MKTIIFFSVLFYSVSCSTQKEIVENGTTISESVQIIKGTVHLSDKGCPFYINAIENGKSIKMYPVNLEDKFKVEGLKIKFSYNLSRAMQPIDCQVDRVISVENVSK